MNSKSKIKVCEKMNKLGNDEINHLQLCCVETCLNNRCISWVLHLDREYGRLDNFHLESMLILTEPFYSLGTVSVPSFEIL